MWLVSIPDLWQCRPAQCHHPQCVRSDGDCDSRQHVTIAADTNTFQVPSIEFMSDICRIDLLIELIDMQAIANDTAI